MSKLYKYSDKKILCPYCGKLMDDESLMARDFVVCKNGVPRDCTDSVVCNECFETVAVTIDHESEEIAFDRE